MLVCVYVLGVCVWGGGGCAWGLFDDVLADFDECLTRLACTAPNTECTNQKGSFVCACKRGFHGLTCKGMSCREQVSSF